MTKKYSCEIQVRFNDFDSYKHVNNVNYLSYFEIARTSFLHPLFEECNKLDEQVIVVDAYVKYLKPVLYGERVIVDVSFLEAGRASFKLHYAIHNGLPEDDCEHKIYTTGYTTHVVLTSDGHIKRLARDIFKEYM